MAANNNLTWAGLVWKIIQKKPKINLVTLLIFLVLSSVGLLVLLPGQSGRELTVRAQMLVKAVSDNFVQIVIINERPKRGDEERTGARNKLAPPKSAPIENLSPKAGRNSDLEFNKEDSNYTVVNYAKDAERDTVYNVITDLGFIHREGEKKNGPRPTNSIWYDQDTVNPKIVKRLAKGFISRGITIYLIRPFEHRNKPHVIEVGSDDDIKLKKIICDHPWSLEDIERVISFNRSNDGCPD